MNKIGTLDIIKAYLGNKELSANNAYIGEISLIKGSGPEPPTSAKYVKVDDLTTLQDGDEFVICTFPTSDWSITDTSIGYVITDYTTNTGRYNGSPAISIENNDTIYQQQIDDISTTFNGEAAAPLNCKIKSVVNPNAGFLIIVNDTKCMYTAKSSNGLCLKDYVDGITEITDEMIFDVSTRNSDKKGTDQFFWCPYVTSTSSNNYNKLVANGGGKPLRYWITMYASITMLNYTFRVFKKNH